MKGLVVWAFGDRKMEAASFVNEVFHCSDSCPLANYILVQEETSNRSDRITLPRKVHLDLPANTSFV